MAVGRGEGEGERAQRCRETGEWQILRHIEASCGSANSPEVLIE
jgi:hypothetical protein